MPIEPYTLEAAEEDIAALRGQVDRLAEILAQQDFSPAGSAPNTPAGGCSLFSAAGHQKYASPDGGTYNTGRATLLATANQGSITATTSLLFVSGLVVGAGKYRIHGILDFVGTGAGATATFGFTGPAVSAGTKIFTLFQSQGTGGTVNPSSITAMTTITSPGYGVTEAQFRFDGTIVFTAAGILGMTAAPSAGTLTIAGGSLIDLMPGS